MGQEHPPATVPGESDLVQQMADLVILGHVGHLVLKLLPLMSYDLAATETPDWNYHFCLLYYLFVFIITNFRTFI